MKLQVSFTGCNVVTHVENEEIIWIQEASPLHLSLAGGELESDGVLFVWFCSISRRTHWTVHWI